MNIKKNTIKIGSVILTMLFCVLCVATPVFATETELQSRIDLALAESLSEFANTELVPLSIWFYDIDETVIVNNTIKAVDRLINDDKLPLYSIVTISQDTTDIGLSVEEAQLLSEAKRDSAKELYENYNTEKLDSIIDKLNNYNVIYSCSYAPNVVIEIQKSEIYRLEYDANIREIYFYDEEALDAELYSDQTTSSDINLEDCCEFIELYDSLTGSGIKVGMTERGWIRQSALPIKNVTDHLYQNKANSNGNSQYTTGHETGVASLLIGNCTEPGKEFQGMVPDATLYHTSTQVNGGWKAGIEWLVESGVNVINISSALISQRYNSSNDASRWLDHIAYQHNITVVVAVGYLVSPVDPDASNVSPFAYSNNIIVVGAVELEKDDYGDYIIVKNQTSAYSSSTRYFPHVVAPGTTGEIPEVTSSDSSQQITGNSGATPQVTAAVTQLMQLEPSLITNPSLVKSLIMAGATGDKFSESIDTSGTDMDRELGAGVLNFRRSVNCLSTASSPKTYTNKYSAGDLSEKSLTLNITENGNIRLALSWQSKGVFGGEENHVDGEGSLVSNFSFLKLTVTSPKGEVYTSFDVQNPIQLLVFDAPIDDLGTYSVTISRHGYSGYETPVSLAVYGADYLI